NRSRKRVTRILDRFLGGLGGPLPAKSEIDAITERAWQRLQSECRLSREANITPEHHVRPRHFWGLAVVAAASVAFFGASTAMMIRTFVSSRVTTVVDNDGATHVTIGDVIKSDGASSTVLTIADGSRIEMRSDSNLSLERADDGI